MITMNKVKARTVDWVDDIVGAVARIAYAGSIHGFEKIVAARIWLATHIQREAKLTEGENASQRWSAARNNELTGALDDWENEGGRC
ncbi:hypothetical protein [Sphingobium sp. EM0848]|uniref:hypothetical protein n=1 Tax=Sphingobium sp. EM0848 TaxID=2743473 RepID=UPI00159CB1C0|nr:hypothetical protein [Sphingobium sp. EM0848]